MSEIQGIAPPDTQPDKALPLPIPESLESTLQDVPHAPKPPALPSLKTLRSWAPLYLQKTDRTISHLNRILSTASGTDTLLMTICYTSLLTSTLLKTLSLARLRHTVRQIIEKAISLPPNTTILIPASSLSIQTSKSLLVSARLKKLSDLISDFRIFVRLWGLLGIWAWGKSVFLGWKEGDDGIVKGIGYAQVVVNILYQYLENGAYLSSKGVLGWSTEKQNKAWLWSSRYWMAHVGLDFVRLGREIVLRRNKQKADAAGEKDDAAVATEEEGKWRAKWRREMVVNLAYAPLTIHWSLEEGLVGDFWVGLLGSVAGITGFRELWKNTGGL